MNASDDGSERSAQVRHAVGNALSVAQALLEAMIDGVLETTPERLISIRDSLATAGRLFKEPQETPPSRPDPSSNE